MRLATRNMSSSAPGRGTNAPQLIDVAVNLTDCVFRGWDWKGNRVHEDDFDAMLARAERSGVRKSIITGTSLQQCERAIALCRLYPGQLYCTVGVHPAHCNEFLAPLPASPFPESLLFPANTPLNDSQRQELSTLLLQLLKNPISPTPSTQPVSPEHETLQEYAESRLQHLAKLIEHNRDVVVAIGEIGLDYAELAYCSKSIQTRFCELQYRAFRSFCSASESGSQPLPFLFHSRDCDLDFVSLLEREEEAWKALETEKRNGAPCPSVRGVVHSFTGSDEELDRLLYFGTASEASIILSVNGTAFREESLARRICTRIPLDRLLLETDSPWCDIREKDYGYQYVSTFFETKPKPKVKSSGRKKKKQKGNAKKDVDGEAEIITAQEKEEEGSEQKEDLVQLGNCCVERRNEPCHLVQVLEAYVGCRNAFISNLNSDARSEGGEDLSGERLTKEEVAAAVYATCISAFPELKEH